MGARGACRARPAMGRVLAGWVGGMVFVVALALFAWAIATITRAGSNVPTSMPTTSIVETGPYRFTRNPIYLSMFLGLVGLAMAFDSLWLLVMLVPFSLIIRYGVVAREEAYLERKFGDAYRQYRARATLAPDRSRVVRASFAAIVACQDSAALAAALSALTEDQ
jgi:protein-S-isoprenylcysteine O-methyltransferase Ste14